jgi:RNA polymerase sigma factor (sigma-70 family)
MTTNRSSDATRDVAALCEQYYPLIRNLCRARLPTAVDAEDATQETLLRFMKADQQTIERPLAWLTTVAVRVCARWHRNRYAKPEAELSESQPDPTHDVAELACGRAQLVQIAKRIPRADYELLHALYVQQLSCREVALRLCTTESHVRVLAFRARQRAARILASFGPAGIAPSSRTSEQCL